MAAVVVVELRRAWRRSSAPALRETDHPILAAEEAVAEAARVARVGYREVSTRENSMFNLLTSFAATFILVRALTFAIRAATGRSVRSATSGWVAGTSTTSCPAS